jgi:5-formyltetrahydrofolate cyclo-ligase
MLKAELRKLMFGQRHLLTMEEVADRSQKIADHFFDTVSLDKVKAVHTFLPIHKNKEVNTSLIIDRIRNTYPEISIVVPVTHFGTNILSHYLITPETELKTNNWGITEPVNAQQVQPTEIDVVIVPLLAFDLQGHRVGYGKGYYDNFLSQTRPGTQKIGVSLFAAVAAIKDVHEKDMALDVVLTPDKVYQFPSL